MGFKVNTSFLQFLTMGALGVRQVAGELKARGFEPVELERYSTSNKIWGTKVKRLRLPDLLCVRTGLRVEVRAKSDLKIRMSDAPKNADRIWDAGQRNEDVVALIACSDGPDGKPAPAKHAVYFSTGALRASVRRSTLGRAKSASEGAERDRTWPAIVPTRPGRVLSVKRDKLVVMMEGDNCPSRKQTYTLNGKHTYVMAGDHFPADTVILAGAPKSTADLENRLREVYNPLVKIRSADRLDRYSAIKALRYRRDLHGRAAALLEATLNTETDWRVSLEAAASATVLGLAKGEERLRAVLWSEGSAELSMEAILILTELKTPFARQELRRAASQFIGDERRQAAIWGLGKTGLKSYSDLVPFISDAEENVSYHAIVAFGSDAARPVIEQLVEILIAGEPRTAAAASEALRVIGSAETLACLTRAANESRGRKDWVLATLGRLPPDMVREHLKGTPLLERLGPMLLVAHGGGWLTTEDAVTDIAFLVKQNL
jgi:hypothetical protein